MSRAKPHTTHRICGKSLSVVIFPRPTRTCLGYEGQSDTVWGMPRLGKGFSCLIGRVPYCAFDPLLGDLNSGTYLCFLYMMPWPTRPEPSVHVLASGFHHPTNTHHSRGYFQLKLISFQSHMPIIPIIGCLSLLSRVCSPTRQSTSPLSNQVR